MKHSRYTFKVAFTLAIYCLIINVVFSQPFVEQTDISITGVYNSDFDWGDYDSDGDLDILISGFTGSQRITKIYRNDGNGEFIEQTNINLYKGDFSSVQWGDYDNDNDLDILLANANNIGNAICLIYRNDGAENFTDSIIIGNGVAQGANANWVDYDNDGDLDVFLSSSSQSLSSSILKNTGIGNFSEQTDISIVGIQYGTSYWADYDEDGDMDVLMTGSTSGDNSFKLYRNNGNNDFSVNNNIVLPDYGISIGSWGDCDNDGDLDILVSGGDGDSDAKSTIYINNGDNTFSRQTEFEFAGVDYASSIDWGDYNNDGDLDIILAGMNNGGNVGPVIKILNNNGNRMFSELTSFTATGIFGGSVSWIDYDNDGDLDLFYCGNTENGIVAKTYRNERTGNKNLAPNAVSGLTSSIQDGNVRLQWSASTDDKTPSEALSYNIRMGTTSGTDNVLPSHSDISNGYRKIMAYGNAQSNHFALLKNLKKGTYYWSVQAIDNHFTGSAFAQENQFTFSDNVQAKGLVAFSIEGTRGKLKWSRGNLDSCIVFIKRAIGTDHAIPVNGASYTANPLYGEGSPIGSSDWYCLYKGINNNVNVSGLNPQTFYRVEIFEYEEIAGNLTYLTDISGSNSIEFTTSTFTKFIDPDFLGMDKGTLSFGDLDKDNDLDIVHTGYNYFCSFSALYLNNSNNNFKFYYTLPIFAHNSSVDMGDYDRDGDLDILLSGCEDFNTYELYTKVLENNGYGGFTDRQDIILPGLQYSSVAWGDYDNDGDLDILISGTTNYNNITEIYQNCGNIFTKKDNIILPGVQSGSLAWGDYDNDDDLDILLTGNDGYKPISKIYQNNNNSTFTDVNILNLPGVRNSCVAWADFNNDSFLDFVLTGHNGTNPVSLIFKNNGDKTFTQLPANTLVGVFNSHAAWGDYDADGNVDILVAGNTGTENFTSIYKNNGDETFTIQPETSIYNFSGCSIAFGDTDNDGDLDVLNAGKIDELSGIIRTMELLRNDQMTSVNEPPAIPYNLTSITSSGAFLQWDMATDDHTASEGLTYNIMLDSVSGGIKIVSPHSDLSTGYFYTATMGNAQTGNSFRIESLKKGTYYWRVQAIDNSFIGGAWSVEDTFSVSDNLSASPDTIYVAGIANRRSSFNIISNVDWNITSDQNWFTTNDSAGFGNQNVIVNAEEWNAEENRVASIFITSSETDTVKIILIQSADYISRVINNQSEDFHVFPNPASDILYFNGLKNENVRIYSLQGSLLMSERIQGNAGFINISSLPNGIYILQTSGKILKIIKNQK